MIAFMLFAASTLSLVAGIYYGIRAKHHPELFWTYLIIGLIFTTPFAIGGYTWYDEIFVGGYLFANLPTKIAIKRKASHTVFAIFIMYMLFQAIRGIAFFSEYGFEASVSKIRWFVFFIIIFLVFIKSASVKLENPFDKDLLYKLTKVGLLFNLIYFAFGLISIYATGTIASTQQAQLSDVNSSEINPLIAIFGATAYAACVLMVIIPATLFTIKSETYKRAKLAWLGLAVALMCQLLFQSRSGTFFILISLSLFLLHDYRGHRIFKEIVFFLPLFFLAIMAQTFLNESDIGDIFSDMLATLHIGEASEDNPLKDIDRRLWNFSAIIALTENSYNFIFGWGLRTSGYIVAPIVYDLFFEARGFATFRDDVGTPGFAGFAVDSGVLGLLLLFLLWMFCLVALYRRPGRVELFMIFAPSAFLSQLFVANIFDVILLYIALMPLGLYHAFFRSKPLLQPKF